MLREKLKQTEAGDRRAAFDAGRGQDNVLDLLANGDGALQRGGEGKLNIDIKKPLVFFGQKAGRKRLAENARRKRHDAKEHQAECGFANQRAADADVAIGQPAITAIEPVEEPPERALACFALWAAATGPTSAGLRDSALKAEMRTEMAMVTANC